MSRPAAAVHRVIKAYDVRGLVGEEIDESLVADVGAAFARLMRGEGARTGGHRPRHAGEFARRWRRHSPTGVTAQGLDVVQIGLASTDQLYFASGLLRLPRRDVHRQPQPGRLQRHQAVPGGREAGRSGHRPGRHPRRR